MKMPYLTYKREESVSSEKRRGKYSCFEGLMSVLSFGRRTSTHDEENHRDTNASDIIPRSGNDDWDMSPGIQKSDIMIPGSRGNVNIGARLKTCVYIQQQSLIHYKHTIELNEGTSLAKQMKIKNEDELLLLNGPFVPFLEHSKVLHLFLDMKVNGQSTNKLVVRRKKKKWYDLSIILSPGSKPDEDVTIHERKRKKLRNCERELPEKVNVYRIPENQHYLVIDDSGPGILPLYENESDSTKLIQTRTILCQQSDGQCVFYVALRDKAMSRYISFDTRNEKISLSEQPRWFRYGTMGGRVHFIIGDFYLGYDYEENKVKLQKSEFWFEEFQPPEHLK